MKAIVLKRFRDKETQKIYNIDDTYEGDKARIDELTDQGYLKEGAVEDSEDVLIADITHTGGGWYELSNGEKIKGKDEALAAEKALKDRSE